MMAVLIIHKIFTAWCIYKPVELPRMILIALFWLWLILGVRAVLFSKEEVERCKQKDLLEEMLHEMTGEFPALSRVFVTERDIFLANSLRLAAQPVRDSHSSSGLSTPQPLICDGLSPSQFVLPVTYYFYFVTYALAHPIGEAKGIMFPRNGNSNHSSWPVATGVCGAFSCICVFVGAPCQSPHVLQENLDRKMAWAVNTKVRACTDSEVKRSERCVRVKVGESVCWYDYQLHIL